MTGAAGTAPRFSWVLLVVVVAALAVGAASSILANSAHVAAPASGPSSLVYLSPGEISIAAAAVIACFFGWALVMRAAGSPSSTLNRMAITALIAIVLAVLFLVVTRLFNLGGPLFGYGNSPTRNGHTGGSGSGGGGGNLTGSGGVVTIPSLPAWVPFAILTGVILIVVAVGVPEVRQVLQERRQRSEGSTAAQAGGVRAALSQASTDLELGADPRATVLALYAAVLARLRPMAFDLDVSTPEEIRAGPLEQLGVRAEAARTLTRLFEEARYSTHPMGADAGDRARQAVRMALDDLRHRNLPT